VIEDAAGAKKVIAIEAFGEHWLLDKLATIGFYDAAVDVAAAVVAGVVGYVALGLWLIRVEAF